MGIKPRVKRAKATPISDVTAVSRLDAELREYARSGLSKEEVRLLVDGYYQMQKDRIANSLRSSAAEDHKPARVLSWLSGQSLLLEKHVAQLMDYYTASHPVGMWMRLQVGIGPIIAAGFLAHINIENCDTAASLWSYAGLAPGKKWNKGEMRPWNSRLKRLGFLAGESFIKMGQREDNIYGAIYRNRKAWEWTQNAQGAYAAQCDEALQRNFGDDTDAKKWYSGYFSGYREEVQGTSKIIVGIPAAGEVFEGPAKGPKGRTARRELRQMNYPVGVKMLPPAHIHSRARRVAVKMFLSHLHEVWYTYETGKSIPYPYPISMLGHSEYHYLPPSPTTIEEAVKLFQAK